MIICADDFGLNQNVDLAILELFKLKKINHVSVLIHDYEKNGKQNLQELIKYKKNIKIGLHLNLFPKISNWIPHYAELEIEAQIKKFEEVFGFFPDYIDGHWHCHTYPLLRSAVLATLKQYKRPNSFFVRSVSIHPDLFKKASLINKIYMSLLNHFGQGFQKYAMKFNIPVSQGLFGAFNNHINFEEIYMIYLKHHNHQMDVLFCHPNLKKNEDHQFLLSKAQELSH